jgi:hypothetical protein
MTIRAVILGILGAAFIAAVTYLNDHVWMLNQMIGSHLPVFVFGVLIVLVMLVNPLLNRLNPNLRFRPKELAVGMLFMLAVCSIPGYGLMSIYPKVSAISGNMYPRHINWQENQLAEMMPDFMLPANGEYVPEFTEGFMTGLGHEGQPIGFNEVPWRFWEHSLTFWMPMVALMAIAVICLGLILHRQWTVNERLRYPIAEIATTLMDQSPGRATPSVFRTPTFWWGLGLILFIRLNNGVYGWSEQNWIQIPLRFDFTAIQEKFVILEKEQWRNYILQPTLYPTVAAIAFLLAADVSFSLGIAPIAIMLVTIYVLQSHGEMIRVTEYMGGGGLVYQRFGSYLALMGVIVYMGRRYYGQVLKRAFAFRPAEGVDASAAWACRILLVTSVVMMMMLTRAGMAWPFSIIIVLLILVTYIGVSRINCEGGLFLNVPRWQPVAVMIGGMGASAMGPEGILIAAMMSVMFTVGVFECFMPFFMNGLRICTNLEIKPARAGVSTGAIYILGLAIAVPAALWTVHNYGANKETDRWWSMNELPEYPYYNADTAVTELKQRVDLTESREFTPMERINPKNWESDKGFWKWVVIGAGLVLVVSVLRLRFHWWPLHPFMFMVWGTRQMAELSASFLLGWLIKRTVSNLGGTPAYNKTKNFMYGAIAGDLAAGLIFMVVSLVQYQLAGVPSETAPPPIFPTMG